MFIKCSASIRFIDRRTPEQRQADRGGSAKTPLTTLDLRPAPDHVTRISEHPQFAPDWIKSDPNFALQVGDRVIVDMSVQSAPAPVEIKADAQPPQAAVQKPAEVQSSISYTTTVKGMKLPEPPPPAAQIRSAEEEKAKK